MIESLINHLWIIHDPLITEYLISFLKPSKHPCPMEKLRTVLVDGCNFAQLAQKRVVLAPFFTINEPVQNLIRIIRQTRWIPIHRLKTCCDTW